jgi:hypothetical protein
MSGCTMLKKIFSIVLMLVTISFSANCHANPQETWKSVAVILDAPDGMFDDSEKMYKQVYNTSAYLFDKPQIFALKPDCYHWIKAYREMKKITSKFSREDIRKITQGLGLDYSVYVSIGNSFITVYKEDSNGNLIKSNEYATVLDFRLWSQNEDDFVYKKRVQLSNASLKFNDRYSRRNRQNTVHFSEEQLKNGLQEIRLDKENILLSTGLVIISETP